MISASRFWFLYVINLFLCIAKSDYWHESLWSLGTGSNRWWCRTQSGDSRTNTPPQTTRLYHIGQCFGHTRCMVSQMLWLWYALIVHIQSLWMVRDYPPPDVLMQGDRPLTAYTLPAKLPPRSGWYIFPIFLHFIFYQYCRCSSGGLQQEIRHAAFVILRLDGAAYPPLWIQ